MINVLLFCFIQRLCFKSRITVKGMYMYLKRISWKLTMSLFLFPMEYLFCYHDYFGNKHVFVFILLKNPFADVQLIHACRCTQSSHNRITNETSEVHCPFHCDLIKPKTWILCFIRQVYNLQVSLQYSSTSLIKQFKSNYIMYYIVQSFMNCDPVFNQFCDRLKRRKHSMQPWRKKITVYQKHVTMWRRSVIG